VIAFYSGASPPYFKFSNFSPKKLHQSLATRTFSRPPSTSINHSSVGRTKVPTFFWRDGGRFASWDEGQDLVWPRSKGPLTSKKKTGKKKGDSWKQKEMIGVMAKMVVNPTRMKKVGIKRLAKEDWIPNTTYAMAPPPKRCGSQY
jgi:hypothetical protein